MSKRRRNKRDTNEYPASIETLSHEGRGIAHVDDRTVFIFNALPGEDVTFCYTKKRSKIAEATSVTIVSPSDKRIPAKCPNFSICGGCSLQHMSGEDQRDFKRQTVLELLDNQKVRPTSLLPTLKGPEWGYRRKARIGVKFVIKKDEMMVGFRERSASLIANMNECHVLDPRVGFQIPAIKKLLYTLDARATIPQLEIAATDERMALIVRHLEPLTNGDTAKLIAFSKELSFDIYLQSKGIDSITLLSGSRPELQYQLPEFNLTFDFLPFQFTQVNNEINQQMVSQAIRLLDLKKSDTLLDLFCGIGNFTLAAARSCKHVIGVEADTLAIDQAKHNSRQNNIDNTEFHVGNLFEDCSDFGWAKNKYTKILLDPPRSGAEQILQRIPHWDPQLILYVSCSPATFARDAAILKTQGYQLDTLGTMDMFAHTQHTEVMGLFKKGM